MSKSICRVKFVVFALTASVILALGLTGCSGSDSASLSATLRSTEYGQIDGVTSADGTTMAWLGV